MHQYALAPRFNIRQRTTRNSKRARQMFLFQLQSLSSGFDQFANAFVERIGRHTGDIMSNIQNVNDTRTVLNTRKIYACNIGQT